MRKLLLALPVVSLAVLAGCSAAVTSHPAPPPAATTSSDPVTSDANGGSCLISQLVDGYCPGSTPEATATETTTAPVQDQSWSFSGHGQWNSPPFALGCDAPVITVKYSYSGNGDSYGPSNFVADVSSATDDQSVTNVIAFSGGTTTSLYPDTISGSKSYHLSVQASGSWKFRLTEACS